MSRKPPPYIPVSLIQSIPREYAWDDWDPYPQLGEQDENTMQQLSQLSDRAIIAFTIGCAEWVVYRFKEIESDPRPFNFLDASWACQMNPEIAQPPESNHREWKGPVRRPIDIALMTILNTMNAAAFGVPAADGAFAELIPLYILNNSELFVSWRDTVLTRLRQTFARNEKDPRGSPVPREILDPKFDLSEELFPQLIKKFLDSLDFSTNPYLRWISPNKNKALNKDPWK